MACTTTHGNSLLAMSAIELPIKMSIRFSSVLASTSSTVNTSVKVLAVKLSLKSALKVRRPSWALALTRCSLKYLVLPQNTQVS